MSKLENCYNSLSSAAYNNSLYSFVHDPAPLVHYINIETIDKEGDASGIYMYYTEQPQKKLAGMLSMHVDTMVPKMSRSYQDVACQIGENKVLL